jgi:hypothetical protein
MTSKDHEKKQAYDRILAAAKLAKARESMRTWRAASKPPDDRKP